MCRDFGLQPLAEDDLKYIPRANILQAAFDGGLERLACEVRFDRDARLAASGNIHRPRIRAGRGQLFDQRIHAPASRFVGAFEIGWRALVIFEPCHRHDGHCLGDVVEHQHVVVEGKSQVRQVAIVRRCIRQILDIAHGVIAGVSHGAAAKKGASQARWLSANG